MNHARKVPHHVALLLLSSVLAGILGLISPAPAWGEEEEYVIGIDDLLQIQVWDNKDLDQIVPVRPDGKISFPLVGEIQAKGLTVSRLANLLTEQLGKSIKNPNVSVIVKEIRSFRVFLIGRVLRPGVHPIKAGTPLLQALTLAGGTAPGGDLSAAYIVRAGERIPVDLHRLIQEADLSQNIPLQTDDTIVVPEIVASANPQDVPERRVYILGKVQKPGVYTIRREIPILHAIFLAGGLVEPAADLSAVFVIRGKERIPVDLQRLIQKGEVAQNLMIRHEDSVVVPDGGDMQNSVFIMGEVGKPGAYPRVEALTMMKLITLAGGFTRFAAPNRITLIREDGRNKENGNKQQVRLRVDLNAIQRDPKANPDIPLAPGDVVIVPQTLF